MNNTTSIEGILLSTEEYLYNTTLDYDNTTDIEHHESVWQKKWLVPTVVVLVLVAILGVILLILIYKFCNTPRPGSSNSQNKISPGQPGHFLIFGRKKMNKKLNEADGQSDKMYPSNDAAFLQPQIPATNGLADPLPPIGGIHRADGNQPDQNLPPPSNRLAPIDGGSPEPPKHVPHIHIPDGMKRQLPPLD